MSQTIRGWMPPENVPMVFELLERVYGNRTMKRYFITGNLIHVGKPPLKPLPGSVKRHPITGEALFLTLKHKPFIHKK